MDSQKKITSAEKLWWYWCGSIWSLSVSRMHESAQTNDELQLGHESSAIRYCWHTHTDTHLYKCVCLCVSKRGRERKRIWTLFSTSAAVVPLASGTSLCSFFMMLLLAGVVTFIPHLQTSVPCQPPTRYRLVVGSWGTLSVCVASLHRQQLRPCQLWYTFALWIRASV